jgi:L-ribulokinase
MAAATAARIYPDMTSAQKAMGSGFEKVYYPIPENARKYRAAYARYKTICRFIETDFTV